jgi:hypothetical protein
MENMEGQEHAVPPAGKALLKNSYSYRHSLSKWNYLKQALLIHERMLDQHLYEFKVEYY